MANWQQTALGGTLLRDLNGSWSDATPAGNVRDLSASSYYNFRIRNYADKSCVECKVSQCPQ